MEATSRNLLLTREVAEALDCSPFTVRRLAQKGVLEPVRLTPKAYLRFRPEDVDRLLRNGKTGEGT